MFIWRVLQGAALVLGISGLQSAMASSIHDWDEGTAVFEGDSPEAQGLSPDTMHETVEPEQAMEEVKFTPKRQNRNRVARKALAQTQSSYNKIRDIKDETATTGENAKKHLPSSTKHKNFRQEGSTYDPVQNMAQVIPQLITINAQ